MRFFWISLLILSSTYQLHAEPDGTIEGRPYVSDGDTFQFPIRLFGVDTPETRQACATSSGQCYYCGSGASDFIDDLFDVSGESDRAKKVIECEFTGETTYGRAVASCFVDGKDVAEELIQAGWALAYRDFLQGHPLEDKYIDAESTASTSKLGMWQGTFVTPEEWRNEGKRVTCSWN